MNSTEKNANGSIEKPLALLAFRQNQPYRTVVRLRIDFDEISLRFSQPALRAVQRISISRQHLQMFQKGNAVLCALTVEESLFS